MMKYSARCGQLVLIVAVSAGAIAALSQAAQLPSAEINQQQQKLHREHTNGITDHSLEQTFSSAASSSTSGNNSSSSYATSTTERELHSGAKVALSLLTALVVLVVGATFVDLNQNPTCCAQIESDNEHRSSSSHHNTIRSSNNNDNLGPRDQRSPSLSSSSSSQMCCSSSNSISSVSAPILGRRKRATSTKSDNRKLCVQLLLAFSMRRSAQFIFQTTGPNSSSTANIDDDDGSQQRDSIDSLHGLRFLSMIWIIVIHSYSFALRWLFFTNSTQLDDVYKTAASQLLANGTFACDSFFFAGGFLLPYLAFPAQTKHIQQPPQQQQQSKNSSQSSSITTINSNNNNHDAPISGRTTKLTFPQNKEAPSWQQKDQSTESKQQHSSHTNEFTFGRALENLLHRYIRMLPLMMAVIGLSATLLRYLGEGPAWDDSTLMFDKWCRSNWWINAIFLHNFIDRENMCLAHSWYSAVDIQLFILGQLILYILFRSKKLGILICCIFLVGAQLLTGALTLMHNLPAVPLIASVSEQSMNLYYGEIYIKPYCRASPYLIGILLAYLMQTTSLGQIKLKKWQVLTGWTASLVTLVAILMAMQPAMNGQTPSELQSALYSALSRPLWACATGWMIFACMTNHGGIFATILSAKFFIPLSRLTYPVFLIHPIVMAVFYGSRQTSFHFSHYLMLYLILGNIVITYAAAFLMSALFELPLLSVERILKRTWTSATKREIESAQPATSDDITTEERTHTWHQIKHSASH